MRKKGIAILLIIMMITISLVTLTSCNKVNNDGKDGVTVNNGNKDSVKSGEDNSKNNNMANADKIQLWYYTGVDSISTDYIISIAERAEEFCYSNDIPLEIFGYNEETLTFDEYKLKRNIAAASGNMIVIEDINSMRDLMKYHADYAKLESYGKLLDIYKGKYCIPLAALYHARYIHNDAMKYYDISVEKPIVTYIDYLNIKQEMKEKGAKFEINKKEFFNVLNYHLYKNGLLYIDEDAEMLNDNNDFKETLKKTVLGILNDILLYYNGDLKIYNNITGLMFDQNVYDQNSELVLEDSRIFSMGNLIEPREIVRSTHDIEGIDNLTFYYDAFGSEFCPSLFLHKKITNESIYDLVNHIASEETYLLTNQSYIYYAPTFKIDKAKEMLKLNDNLEFVGEYEGDPKIREIVNYAYEILVKNEEKSKELSNSFFYNFDFYNEINFFILDLIEEVDNKLISENLSLKNLDGKNEKINKLIDDKLGEFVTNFIIHNN